MPTPKNKPNPLDACNPALNATVSASAGSGKTWLLITRIVRLLIAGGEPGNIIALTFTRKAAGEMQIRLNERLFAMATASEEELGKLLGLIGCGVDEQTKKTAAGLYEKLMHSLYPVRIQTFHSFCQDILSRFPLEADIPPGFDLIEDSSLLERQALQMLFDEARQPPATQTTSDSLNDALDNIMQFCNGPDNTLTSLHSFLAHRSDWWAYTAHAKNPVDFACSELARTLQLDATAVTNSNETIAQFLDDSLRQMLSIFASLLREIKNKTSDKHADSIDAALKQDNNEHCFALIESAFLKKDGEVLCQGRKRNAAMEKKLGTENTEKFLELHNVISAKIIAVIEQLKRLQTLKINQAWYCAGQRYVEIYQQLKTELRLLDFTDLEWKCYQLLQHADNAHWVQYKIDQRIDHILIDEFQDTNPTQWHLLSPLLEEIAANPEQRPRSVFLVGDEKQSIYSFRRANPALQAQASHWLAARLDARATPLDFSRRSSSAIIHCVNQIFEQPGIQAVMTGFIPHGTHLVSLPGKVVLCDLFEENTEDTDDSEAAKHDAIPFRNPLKQAREISDRTLRHDEADFIARQIQYLTNSAELITDDGAIRQIEFGDIMILMRNRTHIGIYEDALKQHSIPFIGNRKGGLLDNLEIRDLNCLLNTLITPYDNLALAQVLKSPIFNASDDDLILLAGQNDEAHWYRRLLLLADNHERGSPLLSRALQRAAELLPRWQLLADHLPVHDCLDRIFSEGNIIKRYAAANRPENRQNIAANCQRFLELSLETDSGRYPSITRFLQRLAQLQSYSGSPPEEPLSQSSESRVRMMTIHGSKGLEAPVVFLADCNSTANNKNAYASLIRWPADRTQPTGFQLQLNKDNTDGITRQLQLEKLEEQKREELNLLYVALTRAREQLYISGCAVNRRQDDSWYQIIAAGLEKAVEHETIPGGTAGKVYRHLAYDHCDIKLPEKDQLTRDSHPQIDEKLLKPLSVLPSTNVFLAPSLERNTDGTYGAAEPGIDDKTNVNDIYRREAAKWRGTVIHRVIELLCGAGVYPATKQTIKLIQQRVKAEVSLIRPAFIDLLDGCLQEAAAAFNHAGFASIFNPPADTATYDEMPVMYLQGQQAVYGIVDRLIRSDKSITIIDYKSHQSDEGESTQQLALQFSAQVDFYRQGIRKLWPAHEVRSGILFTRQKEIVWLD